MQNKLAAWLAEHHKSQKWLAARVGVTQAMISYIIAERRAVPSWLAKDIAQLTGLRPLEVGRVFIPKGRGRKRRGTKEAADASA
jgi:DNA-binding XRE family transcriptional regulator